MHRQLWLAQTLICIIASREITSDAVAELVNQALYTMCYYNQQLWLILTDYSCNYECSHVVLELWLLLIVAVAMAVLFKEG